MTTKTNHVARVTGNYILIILLATVFSWLLHEFSHWLTGTLLGNTMAMTFNTGYPVNGSYASPSHENMVSIAGPLVTLLQAAVVFLIMKYRNAVRLYPFLFVCFYMRLLAAVLSIINPNDEARVSMDLGLGKFTLHIMIVAILFSLVYLTARRYHFSKKFNAATLGFIILFSSVIVLSDQSLHLKLL